MSIDSTYKESDRIRIAFQEIERKPWQAKEFSMELIVQVGHLADMILRQEAKLNRYTQNENSTKLADEISDVILNIFSISQILDIPLHNYIGNYLTSRNLGTSWKEFARSVKIERISNQTYNSDPSVMCLNLANSCANLGVSIIGRQHLQITADWLLKTIDDAALLVDYFQINVEEAFENMAVESLTFISRNKNV